jgi:hypothetical protein
MMAGKRKIVPDTIEFRATRILHPQGLACSPPRNRRILLPYSEVRVDGGHRMQGDERLNGPAGKADPQIPLLGHGTLIVRDETADELEEVRERAEIGERTAESLRRHYQYWSELVWLKPIQIMQRLGEAWMHASSPFPIDSDSRLRKIEEFQQFFWEPVNLAANQMWRATECGSAQALDNWLASEKYVLSLASIARKFTGAAIPDEKSLSRLSQAFSPYAYLRSVQLLAAQMASDSGQQPASHGDYWLSAERYVVALVVSSSNMAKSLPDAIDTLTTTFRDLSPLERLQRVRNEAFLLWCGTGADWADPLPFWLDAERKYLERIIRGYEH